MKNKSQYRTYTPFQIEDLRNKAALKKDKKEFISLYNKNIPAIKNVNTDNFWDQHFKTALSINDQDSLTKDKIKKIISLLPNKKIKILDLGFGQGYFEEKLQHSEKKYNIFGIDISSVATKKANDKFKGKFIQGDIAMIKKIFDKEKFDVILAIELIEHVLPSDILAFYDSINRLLKNNGILILSTPLNENLRNSKKNPSGHVRDYQPAVIKMELELSGFKILETHQLYAFKKYYYLKKLLAKILPRRWEPNNIIVKAIKS